MTDLRFPEIRETPCDEPPFDSWRVATILVIAFCAVVAAAVITNVVMQISHDAGIEVME